MKHGMTGRGEVGKARKGEVVSIHDQEVLTSVCEGAITGEV